MDALKTTPKVDYRARTYYNTHEPTQQSESEHALQEEIKHINKKLQSLLYRLALKEKENQLLRERLVEKDQPGEFSLHPTKACSRCSVL